jgi:hypothetical protein
MNHNAYISGTCTSLTFLLQLGQVGLDPVNHFSMHSAWKTWLH